MATINEMELQTLRHLIMANDTLSCKMSSYSEQAESPEFKQYFQKSAQTAKDAKQQLMGFLK